MELHPAAKGAIIGGAVGAGAIGAIGLWYCTVGPHESGSATGAQIGHGTLRSGARSAGIGAVIGALR